MSATAREFYCTKSLPFEMSRIKKVALAKAFAPQDVPGSKVIARQS